jgi:ATP-dependent exoDNAse (exonuclease V) beta subunit
MENILFNEAEHKYYDTEGKIYTSVTTLIGQYTNTFDEDFWAIYTALKEKNFKVKPQPEVRQIYVNNVLFKSDDLIRDARFKNWYDEIKARWKSINFEACERGNNTHNELELGINQSKGDLFGLTNNNISSKGDKVLATQHDLDNTIIKSKYPEVYIRLSGYINNGFSIFAEKKVFLKEFLLAGMIDVPLVKNKHFCILDWKTNKDELKTKAGYYKKSKIGNTWVKTDIFVETGECFKFPLNHLEASKFNIYSLQLSTYAYILEQWGYILVNNGLEIIHFPLGSSPKLIKIPYLKREVEIMLNHHKQNILCN